VESVTFPTQIKDSLKRYQDKTEIGAGTTRSTTVSILEIKKNKRCEHTLSAGVQKRLKAICRVTKKDSEANAATVETIDCRVGRAFVPRIEATANTFWERKCVFQIVSIRMCALLAVLGVTRLGPCLGLDLA